jgi:hypothetical protein
MMNKRVIDFLKKSTLEDKEDILSYLLQQEDTFLYLHSDKRQVGFDIPLDFKSDDPSRSACLNGLSIQVNLDLDKAEMTSAHKSIKCKNWNKVKLNSFKI